MVQNKRQNWPFAHRHTLDFCRFLQFAVVLRTMFSVCLDSRWFSLPAQLEDHPQFSSYILNSNFQEMLCQRMWTLLWPPSRPSVPFNLWIGILPEWIPQRLGGRFCEVQDVEFGVLFLLVLWVCFTPKSVERRIHQTAIVQTNSSMLQTFPLAACVTFSPGAPLASSAASTISHLPSFPEAIWPRSCVPAAWSPTPRCLVVCDRCHESVGVMISQEPSFLSKDLTVFHAILFANAESVPEAIAEVFSRIDHKFDLMQHARKTTVEVWFEVNGKGNLSLRFRIVYARNSICSDLRYCTGDCCLWWSDLFCHWEETSFRILEHVCYSSESWKRLAKDYQWIIAPLTRLVSTNSPSIHPKSVTGMREIR